MKQSKVNIDINTAKNTKKKIRKNSRKKINQTKPTNKQIETRRDRLQIEFSGNNNNKKATVISSCIKRSTCCCPIVVVFVVVVKHVVCNSRRALSLRAVSQQSTQSAELSRAEATISTWNISAKKKQQQKQQQQWRLNLNLQVGSSLSSSQVFCVCLSLSQCQVKSPSAALDLSIYRIYRVLWHLSIYLKSLICVCVCVHIRVFQLQFWPWNAAALKHFVCRQHTQIEACTRSWWKQWGETATHTQSGLQWAGGGRWVLLDCQQGCCCCCGVSFIHSIWFYWVNG